MSTHRRSSNPDGVSQERTFWRDEAISQRHRLWGEACAAVDLDFILVEYSYGTPKALVEYKARGAKRPDLQHSNIRALCRLADASRIAFFVVLYDSTYWYVRVTPVNAVAKTYCSSEQVLSEREYVTLLYKLRGLSLPPHISERLNTLKSST